MSQNAPVSPPSRPPSSASYSSSGSAASQQRHERPLPPPRLPAAGPEVPASPRPAATSFRSAGRAAARPGAAVPVLPAGSPVAAAPAGPGSPAGSASNTGPAGAPTEVSLEAPRPDVVRVGNEYVETPFRPAAQPAPGGDAHQIKPSNHQRSPCPSKPGPGARLGPGGTSSSSSSSSSSTSPSSTNSSSSSSSSAARRPLAGTAARPVTKQPVSFTKQPATGRGEAASLSIMCDQCGRCKCESCREPQAMPSCWICKNSCLCSCESVVDYVSCLCCVKGIFYHCADGAGPGASSAGGPASVGGLAGIGAGGNGAADSALDPAELGGSCADEPCSCAGSRKTARWTFMSAMTLMLPCLICYWPLKGCHYLCEACYARRMGQGCRCEARAHGGLSSSARQALNLADGASDSARSRLSEALMKADPEKRLLDPLGAEL